MGGPRGGGIGEGKRLELTGERIRATYSLTGDRVEAMQRAQEICVEQTVEFPADLIGAGDIPAKVIGRIDSMRPLAPDRHEVEIAFSVEVAGGELTQLLNLLFGNISLKPGIRLEGLELPASLLERLGGPRFGRAGLRALLGAPGRPLLCTALKPMGLSPAELADLATSFALGGMDMIKDDHGLADQPFCPFEERVARCAEAVARASERTGRPCLYLPNVSAGASALPERARFAKLAGAGGLLISPGLTGFDSMRALARDDEVALPIMAHPALLGSFLLSPGSGISHDVLLGRLMRLAGADATIFPNYGGRFSFSEQECRSIVEGTGAPMGSVARIFPVPAGGMSLERVPEMCAFYGRDVVFLIGGDLHRRGDLVASCEALRRAAGAA